MAGIIVQPVAISNMFLGLQEPNVTFCLDISGSMYNKLNFVREHLSIYLYEQAYLTNLNFNRLFNLIAFSTEIYPWANKMVLWNNATVTKAIHWLTDLETKTGTNTLDALTTAFEDLCCSSVVLITDDICDQEPHAVLNQVNAISHGRPCHCVYVTSACREDKAAIDFLQHLSMSTNGFFKMVVVGRQGIEKVVTMRAPNLTGLASLNFLSNTAATATHVNTNNHSYSQLHLPPQQNLTSMMTSTAMIPASAFLSDTATFRTDKLATTFTGTSIQHAHPHEPLNLNIASHLLINQPVVARVDLDGYFYRGTVMEQVANNDQLFTIQFGPNTYGKQTFKDYFYQPTPIYDIIHFEDGVRHPVKINDYVLAYVDARRRYGPAVVLSGFENRVLEKSDGGCCYSPLIVKFSDGQTRTLPPNEAIWITPTLYDRIKFELSMPLTARKYLSDKNVGYPDRTLPGYPASILKKSGGNCDEKPIRSSSIVLSAAAPTASFSTVSTLPLAAATMPATTTMTSFGSAMPSVPLMNFMMPTREILNPNQRMDICCRQIKTNPAAVDAEIVNKNVFGSSMNSEELDRKIKKQIAENIHLLMEDVEKSYRRRSSFSRSASKDRHDHHHTHKQHHHKHDCPNSAGNSRHASPCHDHHKDHDHSARDYDEYNENEAKKNKYFKFYKCLIDEMYEQINKIDNNDNKRSRSVESLDSYRDHQGHNHHHHHHHDCHSDDEQLLDSHRSNVSYSSKSSRVGGLERFGNPKVSIGLPDRPGHKVKSKSASDVFNLSTTSAPSSARMRSSRKMFPIKSEMPYILNPSLNESSSKTKNASTSTANHKVRVPDYPYLPKADENKAVAKRISKSVKSAPKQMSAEDKDLAKVDYLQKRTAQRSEAHFRKIRDQAIKEANKIGFKRSVQQERDKIYHDKLLIEEAKNRADYQHTKLANRIQNQKEVKREQTEQQLKFLKSQLKK